MLKNLLLKININKHKFVQKVAKVDFYYTGFSMLVFAFIGLFRFFRGAFLGLSGHVGSCLGLSGLVWACDGLVMGL